MKATATLFALVLLCLLNPSCKKENAVTPPEQTTINEIDQAQTALEKYETDNPAQTPMFAQRKLSWVNAEVKDGGKTILVPLSFKEDKYILLDSTKRQFIHLNDITRLKITKKEMPGSYDYTIQIRIPDERFLSQPNSLFTGLILQEDWLGNQLQSQKVTDPTNTSNGRLITICTTVEGYNYATGDPDHGYSWSRTTCSIISVQMSPIEEGYSYGGGGGEGGGAANPGSTPPAPPPTKIVANVPDYMKCFSNNPSSSYSVKICVDQPTPGRRTPWSLHSPVISLAGNPVNVGHTFLVLTQTTGDYTTVRNIGFYPRTVVTPFGPTAPGVFNNDEMHDYNVSGSFTMTAANFMNMVQYINGLSGVNYNLNTFNCTTFGLDALSAGHIYLPYTVGSWLGGMGADPGDLGVDIMNSNSPGIIKSQTSQLHMNNGSCN